MNTKHLISIGGSEWIKGTMHRIYFNSLHTFYGLELEYYNSGNISSAWLDGDKISNSYGAQLDNTLRYAKVWYDVTTGTFFTKNLTDGQAKKIVSAIKLAAEAAEQNAEVLA